MPGVYNPRAKGPGASRKQNEPIFTGAARPKIVVPNYDVFEAALDRIRWLFDEFENKVLVSTSGGKDSTIVLELAAKVARERGVVLEAMFLDQECEFQSTIDYQRYIMNERDDINLRWYQVPFLLENSTNHDDPWLHVWGEGEEWVREKEPNSIHENTYGQDKFHEILSAISTRDWNGCQIDGIRADESPARRLLTTSRPMYKWVTWANVDADPAASSDPANHRFRFHPIYDWQTPDIWKAIHDNHWRYNTHYDHLYQHGVATKNMRVSNYHHEGALTSLHWLQEIEPETWEAATRRLAGISTYGQLHGDQYPKTLPYMFKDWVEYMHHLIDNLATQPEHRDSFLNQWATLQRGMPDTNPNELAQVMVKVVIGNDFYGTSVNNYLVTNRKKKKLLSEKQEAATA